MPHPSCAFPLPCEQPAEATRLHRLDTRAPEHHHIEAAKAFDVVAEALPDQTLQPMTSHGAGHDTAPDGESESGTVHLIGAHHDGQNLSVQTGAPGEYAREILPPTQPTLLPQVPIGAILLRRRVASVLLHAAR